MLCLSEHLPDTLAMEKYIRDLIRQGENAEVEFKKTVSSLPKIAKTISSMANTKGGTLLIGVDDNGMVVGAALDEELYMLQEASTWYVKPALELVYEEQLDPEGRAVLLVSVPNSTIKPHACLSQDHEWRYYIRSGDRCVQASDLVLKALKAHDPLEDPADEDELPSTYNVQALVMFLKAKKRITLPQYAKLINVHKRRANRILIQLVQAGKLHEHTYEKTIFYTLV